MLNYYFRLTWGSFRRSWKLTALMIVAIALGVAMTMTAYTILYVMSADPIPEKSDQLFTVQIDNGGPHSRNFGSSDLPEQLSYRDSMALLNFRAGKRQAAMHQLSLTVAPPDRHMSPFTIYGRATSADFFAMFDVPMLRGRGWAPADEARAIPVVVLSGKLNTRLFGGENSIGRSVNLDGAVYQVIGVVGDWDPRPRFYDVVGGLNFDEPDDAYMPLAVSIARGMGTAEYISCNAGPAGRTFDDLLRSECAWLQFWVELPTTRDFTRYRNLLDSYARDQQRSGRFAWPPNTRLLNVRDWLVAEKVVPDDAKLSVLVAFGFFVVCLVSALSLMLAKEFGRTSQLGMRRAMGASRRDVFAQVVVESGVVGLLGGALGLGLVIAALWVMRTLFPVGMGRIAHLDGTLVAQTIAFAIAATLVAGVYPAWSSMRIAPALQIKGG